MAKYSFVLPAYKSTFLKEAIDSILAQTYQDFELIIVNDASLENLDSIVQKYNDPRISYYVNEQNIGGIDLVAQWNHSISYATGEYLILASDDDVYLPTYLEKMDVLTQKYPLVNVYRPLIQHINENGEVQRQERTQPDYMSQLEFIYNWFIDLIASGIPYYMFKRDALMKVGGFKKFPLAWFCDDATVMELTDNGIAIYNEVLFSFRNSGINISSRKKDISDLIKKMDATDLFYIWFPQKIKEIQTKQDEAPEVLYLLNKYKCRERSHLIWLILDKTTFRCIVHGLRHLSRLKSLSKFDICKIYYRVTRNVIKKWFMRITNIQ